MENTETNVGTYFTGLDKYGKVEQNEKRDGKYFIKISDGFVPGAKRTMDLLKSILDQIEEKNLVVEKFITDINLYYMILKPKK